jgi:Family of unknown function (DUF6428)
MPPRTIHAILGTMTIDEFRTTLEASPTAALHFRLPDGDSIPAHFHITEVGRVQKDFIDCGGTVRSATSCLLQAWLAPDDAEHRLEAGKLAHIIRLAAPLLRSGDLPVEVEYEDCSLSQFPVTGAEVTPTALTFLLASKHTDCLAKESCGVGDSAAQGAACEAGTGCC